MAVLGIDTSNYKTSIALVSDEGILLDERILLSVKKGERGLRQQEALFQHVVNLPALMEKVRESRKAGSTIRAVAVSSRPRPVEGSYMPVFNAGIMAAETAGAVLDVPVFTFSHQEGHIRAAREGTELPDGIRFLAYHFSGGTTEAVLVEPGGEYALVGGTKDISYGQLLDRVGVALGMDFPAGGEMDRVALAEKDGEAQQKPLLPRIRTADGYVNLSGIESACQRIIRKGEVPQETLIRALFKEIVRSIRETTVELAEKYQVRDVLFAGGVSSSQYMRRRLEGSIGSCRIYWGRPELSSDNAVGTALLGRDAYGA